MARGAVFFESPRAGTGRQSVGAEFVAAIGFDYYVPCRIREHCVAVLGLGKTVDGDFLSSDDVELVETIAGYVAVALDNAQLYNSLEQKALEIVRLKDFSENIVESLNVGVLAVDLGGLVESWNTRMEQLFGVTRQEAVGAQLNALLPQELATEIASRGDGEQITGIYKQRASAPGQVADAECFDYASREQVRRKNWPAVAVRRCDAAGAYGRADVTNGKTDIVGIAGRGAWPMK